MESLTIRISRSTHDMLRSLADATDMSMSTIVDKAVSDFRRKKFWADYHAAYAALRADPGAWADHQRESEAWETTIADGLGDQ